MIIGKRLRSPLFYVGDKYKLMPQLAAFFPDKIDRYFEPFVGGGSSFLAVQANQYLLNDIDTYIIKLHRFLTAAAPDPDLLFSQLFDIIYRYDFTVSALDKTVPQDLKVQFPKTYFAHYNKDAFLRLRKDFNANKEHLHYLYLLLIYGFNHFLRFNSEGNFNLPVGNVDFNKNVQNALIGYMSFVKERDITFYNMDYRKFLAKFTFKKGDFIYLDPPYLISASEYNRIWNKKNERELLDLLDDLHKKKVKFAISNLLEHKGCINTMFKTWAKKYYVHIVKSNYISYHDNTQKNSTEVLVTNYVP